jgi:uncharacterized repeat protein (TIGR02543 family)
VVADGGLVLKLYYNRNINTIHFETNGGSPVEEIKGKYGSQVSTPASPTRLDYTFTGWYSDSTLKQPYQFTSVTIPAEKLTLYAGWDVNSEIGYKVEHYTQVFEQDVSDYKLRYTEELKGAINTKVSVTPMAADGYVYNSLKSVASGTLVPGGNLILKLYFDRKTSTISFESNGGNNVASITQPYGTNVSAPEIPTRLGYLFAGWYVDEGLTFEYNFSTSTMPTADLILYAKWTQSTVATYKVEYYQEKATLDGYMLAETKAINGTVDTTVTAAAITYTGFSENTAAPGTLPSGVVKVDGSLTLKRYYDRNTYTISFFPFNNVITDPISGKYGTKITAPKDPIINGRIFCGWYMDINLTKPFNFDSMSMPAENLKLYPRYQ